MEKTLKLKKILKTGEREQREGQKHSEVRPQSGQVYNYKALQRVAGEPAVLTLALRPVASFLYDFIFLFHLPFAFSFIIFKVWLRFLMI